MIGDIARFRLIHAGRHIISLSHGSLQIDRHYQTAPLQNVRYVLTAVVRKASRFSDTILCSPLKVELFPTLPMDLHCSLFPQVSLYPQGSPIITSISMYSLASPGLPMDCLESPVFPRTPHISPGISMDFHRHAEHSYGSTGIPRSPHLSPEFSNSPKGSPVFHGSLYFPRIPHLYPGLSSIPQGL